MRPADEGLAAGWVDLARKIANGFNVPDRQNLLGEALLALVLAEQSFDPARGRPFGTWAARLIRQACIAEARRQKRRVPTVPLDVLFVDDEHGDRTKERPELAVEVDLAAGIRARELRAAVAALPAQQETVIRLRFGLDDGIDRTQEEVAKRLELSRTRIWQIETNALDRLARKLVLRRRRRTRIARLAWPTHEETYRVENHPAEGEDNG